MSYRADKLGDGRTNGRTGVGNDNTRRSKLASGENATTTFEIIFSTLIYISKTYWYVLRNSYIYVYMTEIYKNPQKDAIPYIMKFVLFLPNWITRIQTILTPWGRSCGCHSNGNKLIPTKHISATTKIWPRKSPLWPLLEPTRPNDLSHDPFIHLPYS